ncbi:MAG TPA: efflux RND transporter periplasmic adaptor subunit [Caulobacteraceae bacterium]
MNSQRLAIAGVSGLMLAAPALWGCGAHQPAKPPDRGPPVVGVITIEPQPVPLQTELAGRTTPYEISDVRPQVGGIVKARLFKEGAIVRAGQVLYQIEPAPYQAAYDQAKALLASAQANVATTRAKAERYGGLVKINAVSKQDYDDAEAAYKQAAANVQQQRAAVESAGLNLGFTRVTAPISGRIGISTVTQGALVTASQTTALTTIQKLDPIYVDLTQSATELLALRRDMALGQITGGGPATARVRLELEDGSAYPIPGLLQFTDITVDPTTGGVTLRAVFPNPAGVLLPGMYVRAVVTEGIVGAGLLAPQEGVARDEKGQPTALIVDAQGRAQLRPLRTARAIGDKWLVTAGLNQGDRLIVEGVQAVHPGAPVHAVLASTLPGPFAAPPGAGAPAPQVR